ncbi:MAG TPA: sulfatase [Vicinamibacteria bacterium]|nr:sulfatase [Vicinamibacteria bacterium]
MSRRLAAAVALGVALAGCPGRAKTVVYDLAARVPVAETWSGADVLRFGTPAAEPRLTDGFHREGGGSEEPFLWSKGEAEVAFRWDATVPRVAILDAAPYRGVKGQAVEVRLNGETVERLRMNDVRFRYRIGLPAAAQRPGDNRLRFVFAATASPADADPASRDERQLAAAFYTLATGPSSDASLEDLLGRDAPRPFAAGDEKGVPGVTLLGPAVVRFALKLPPSAELRFTPELLPAARAAAGAASFRVTVEGTAGGEREAWARVIGARDAAPGEQVVRLPGRPGDVVEIGLGVGAASSPRFAWGRFVAPRVLGEGGAEPLQAIPTSPADDARADGLRKALAGANVLLVILDAARAQSFPAYGYGRPTTPEIDRIASEGVVFERVYTPAVYTLGAMASLWTSQYPDRHHSEVSFSARLPKDRLTLAEVLSGQGIHTAGFVANAVAGKAFGFDRGFSEFDEVFRTLGSRGDVFRQALPPWLAANRGRRFFLYVHFREPHFPYDPEPPFDTKFGPDGPIPKGLRRDIAFFTDVNQGRRPFGEAEREHLVRLYDGNLAFADQEVGALRKSMEEEGLWERTVVIVAADHGEELFERGWIGHNVHLYEPSVHVPLIVRFPKGAGPSGKRVAALADLLDVGPTIADVLGSRGTGGSDREFQGRSLLPAIEGAPGKPAVLSRTVWDRPRYALRDERFKFSYDSRTGEERLYDLATDPGETRDRGPAEPLRAAYYRQALHAWTLKLARRTPAGGEAAQMTCEQCENLKALGYVQEDCSARCR